MEILKAKYKKGETVLLLSENRLFLIDKITLSGDNIGANDQQIRYIYWEKAKGGSTTGRNEEELTNKDLSSDLIKLHNAYYDKRIAVEVDECFENETEIYAILDGALKTIF